jgi:hypothetical protein
MSSSRATSSFVNPLRHYLDNPNFNSEVISAVGLSYPDGRQTIVHTILLSRPPLDVNSFFRCFEHYDSSLRYLGGACDFLPSSNSPE